MISYRKFLSFLIPYTIFAILMSVVRTSFSSDYSYLYMNWNLFLAFLPLVFLYLYEKERLKILRYLFFFLWLLFLPNAIYMLTDFIHLRDVGPRWLLWYDAMMLFTYAMSGLFIHIFSLGRMEYHVSWRPFSQKIFVFFVSLFISFGVYLGRYLRLNSWDVFISPFSTLRRVLEIFSNFREHTTFLSFIVFFTLFSLVSVYAFPKER